MKEDSIPNELGTIAIQLDSIVMQLYTIVAKSVDSENIFNTEVTVGIITFVGVLISAFINRYYSKKIINEEYDLKFNEKIIDKKIKAFEAMELITKETCEIITGNKPYPFVFTNINKINKWEMNLNEMISSHQYSLNDYEYGLLYNVQIYKVIFMKHAIRICSESSKGINEPDEGLIKLGEILYEDFNYLHSILDSIIRDFYHSNEKNYTKKRITVKKFISLNVSLRKDEIKKLYKREK